MKRIFVVLALAFAFITAMPITTVMAEIAACTDTGSLPNLSTADIWRALGVN
jgi:hypothetical protein